MDPGMKIAGLAILGLLALYAYIILFPEKFRKPGL
jgi:hypothetical protein